jgi:hypothetical protein
MSRDAFPKIEREYAEAQARQEHAKMERGEGATLSGSHQIIQVPADDYRQLQLEAALWRKVAGLMTHERSGPNVGWTLSIVLPGDTPADAVNDYRDM